MKKQVLHILSLLLLAALLAAGCRRLPLADSAAEQQAGVLKLRFSAGDATSTKAGTPDPTDGDTFHNILVVVADTDGTVVQSVLKQYPCTAAIGNVPPNQDEKDVESTDTDWIYFINLKVGYYHVYAFANIEETDWMDAALPDDIGDIAAWLIGDPAYRDRQFATMTGSDSPAFPDHCMLLTGHDELYVGVDPYIGRIELVRPVVKFEVVLDNHTPFHLQLTDLHFNDFNASSTFMIGRTDEDGLPVLPDDNAYRPLPPFSGPANIPSNTQAMVYSRLLYENRLGQDYRMFATVRFADENGQVIDDESGHPLTDDNGQPLSRVLTSSGVRRVPYEDIRDLPPGASMDVLMTTPNTGNGGFLGYWNSSLAFSNATYNFEESFRSKATSLLNDRSIGQNYKLRLHKDDNGKYHVYREAKDLFTAVSNSGLYLQEGYLPTQYPISQEFLGSLCRFTEGTASNAKSLFYNNLALKLDGNSNYGNRMWTFYEIHPEGTVLKLIDRESSRVSTLTHMARGQKLTAVMNVYYESETGEFTFSLDNTYWENGHNPKYTFD